MKKCNNGSILITTLWIMAILSLFALGVGFRASIEVRLNKYNFDKLEAVYLAKAGFLKSMELLGKDTNEYDNLYACGITLEAGKKLEDLFASVANKLGDGSFSICYKSKNEKGNSGIFYGMMDEERKINLNFDKLAPGNLAEYKRIIKGLSPNMTDEIVNAVIDWQDTDDNRTYPGGAEDFEYEAELGYSSKDERFSVPEELLLVKGVTAELYKEIKDNITTFGSGKININTASEGVLTAVIDDGKGTYASLIENIIKFRQGEDGLDGTSDDGTFLNVVELMGLAEENFEKDRISQMSSLFSVKSDTFRIESRGEASKIIKEITFVAERTAEKGKKGILYYHED